MLKILCVLLMINSTLLSQRLAGLVGFRQPYNPNYQVIDLANQASRSGYFITDNPFVKIESIKDSQDYQGIADIDFNSFFYNFLASSAVFVVNTVFNESDFIDRQILYRHALNKFDQTNGVNTDNLPTGFSCYWLKPSGEKNIAFNISRVFLEFDGAGDITLLLFNTANLKAPLQTKTVTVNQPFFEVELNWTCDNSKAGSGYKGDYYLGYFTKDMSLKPFKREYREALVMSNISELECIRSNFSSFTQLSDPFDLNKPSTYNPYNGINPDITMYEDYTDMIIQNEKLFARAIMLDCQISLLTESVASLRSNRNERISAQYIAQLMAQIEGETGENNVKVKGLRPQFFGAIASIKKELKKLQKGYSDQYQIAVQTLT